MVGKINLKFIHRDAGRNIEMDLVSKFTCIDGKDSGEGKSEFLTELQQGIQLGEISCNLGDNFAIADAGSINALLQLTQRTVIMMDETVGLRSEILKKMYESRHVFICITRSMILHFDYHIRGIYCVSRKEDWFAVERAAALPLLRRDLSIDDNIITESREFRSEHQLLTDIGFKNMTAACGRDEIEKKLRRMTVSAVVFADLAAIGRAYRILMKRCGQNAGIRFFNYESFEHLLCCSKLFEKQLVKSRLRSFDFITLERYYEKLLEEITAGTDFSYMHGRPLPEIYSKYWKQLLDSDYGRPLLNVMR